MTQVTERGWAGHYICAHYCRYRRNTLVSSEGRHVVVSSVGNMHHDEQTGMKTIGAGGRYYETMVFRGAKIGPYIDAIIAAPIYPPEPLNTGIFAECPEELADSIDSDADAMHDAIVAWVREEFEEAYYVCCPSAETVKARED